MSDKVRLPSVVGQGINNKTKTKTEKKRRLVVVDASTQVFFGFRAHFCRSRNTL